MTRIVFALVAAGLLSPAIADDWVEYKSENFTVYSDAPQQRIVPLLERFEVFRLTALSLLSLPAVPDKNPPLIIALDRDRDFDRLSRRGVAGYFYHSIFGPRMVVGPGQANYQEETLFHEYVHYLMYEYSPVNYPDWYFEGMATLLMSAAIDDSGIKVGNPPNNFENAIEARFQASVREIVSGKYEGSATAFYVSSWLLSHYLMLNTSRDALDPNLTRNYLALYDSGVDPIEAFEQGFGMTPLEMQRKIRRYVTRSRIGGLESPGVQYSGEIVQRRMGEGEYQYLLGDIAVEQERHESAHRFFDEFDELVDVVVDRRKVASRRAIALIHDGRLSDADRLVNELIASALDDPDLLADIAHYAIDRYLLESGESHRADERDLRRSIEFGERAVSSNPTDLEALFYLGLAYENAGDLQRAADILLQSYDINPSVPRLNHNLARVMIRGRQPELAAYLLRRLYSATHNEGQRAKYTSVIEEIEDGEYDVSAVVGILSD